MFNTHTIATVTKQCPTCGAHFTINTIAATFGDLWGIDECPDCVEASLPAPCNICEQSLTAEEAAIGDICADCRNEHGG